MTDIFSNEIAGKFTPGPAAPVLLKIAGDGQPARAYVQLPTLAKDGSALTTLEAVNVFCKTGTMAASTPSAEKKAGTLFVSLAVTPAQAGETVVLEIPGLLQDGTTEYFFDASCD